MQLEFNYSRILHEISAIIRAREEARVPHLDEAWWRDFMHRWTFYLALLRELVWRLRDDGTAEALGWLMRACPNEFWTRSGRCCCAMATITQPSWTCCAQPPRVCCAGRWRGPRRRATRATPVSSAGTRRMRASARRACGACLKALA